MNKKRAFCLFILAFLWTQNAIGGVSVAGRHVVVLYKSIDSVMGTYLFLVNNDAEKPLKAKLPIMLPKETLDFEALNGVGRDELKLGKEGGLILEKEFRQGDSLMSIGFRVPASIGEGELTFEAVADVEVFSVFVRPDTIEVSFEQEGYEKKENVPFGANTFTTFTKKSLPKGESTKVFVSNIPKGRGQYWLLGFIAGGLMFVIGGYLAYRTRPVGFS